MITFTHQSAGEDTPRLTVISKHLFYSSGNASQCCPIYHSTQLVELHLLKWVSEMARSRIRIGQWFSKSSICYHRENVIFFVFLGSVIELLIERFKKLMEQEELVMARDSGLVARALV